MKITVVYHSADFDGIFCREIARKFLPDAELIGWDFKDKPLPLPSPDPDHQLYVLDLPLDRPFGLEFGKHSTIEPVAIALNLQRTIWIDHHKTSIDSHPTMIPGYRIDGVAACRLAWQWFTLNEVARDLGADMPFKEDYGEHRVHEPLAVRLAGEYDIWDKRDPRAEVFQFGLRSRELTEFDWRLMLSLGSVDGRGGEEVVAELLRNGELLQRYQQSTDKGTMGRSFLMDFEGLKFLALNTARCNSLTFASKDVPETGHDALLGFYYDGEKWNVSMYHAKHRMDLDLSQIAVKHGGGGHKGACGFHSIILPFEP
jgi:hypothetical protein